MIVFVRQIKHLLKSFWYLIKKNIASTIEELRAIIRNRNYMIKYPKLFAIFSIIEHEQSPQVFELNQNDFQLIKKEILNDDKISNHHILDSLRNIFQITKLSGAKNLVREKILNYIHDELESLIEIDNSYQNPLIKAILQGFPLILNYNDYSILKKILHRKSHNSLLLIKYILDSENFPNFFINNDDIIDSLLISYQINNKFAFMLFVRYLRQNNLFFLVFEKNSHDIKNKIFSAHVVQKKGIDCSSVMLSYYEDKWFTSDKKIEKIEQFLYEIFSHQINLDQKQKLFQKEVLSVDFFMSRRLGYENFIIEKILNKISERFIYKKNKEKFLRIKFLTDLKKSQTNKPSEKIMPQRFFSIRPLGAEEHWLLRFANYLLN